MLTRRARVEKMGIKTVICSHSERVLEKKRVRDVNSIFVIGSKADTSCLVVFSKLLSDGDSVQPGAHKEHTQVCKGYRMGYLLCTLNYLMETLKTWVQQGS